MNREQIKEAAAKASEEYMENTPIMSVPKGSYRDGFIAGAEWITNYLCNIPFDKIIYKLHAYTKEKLENEKKITYDT